jgi:hypothetical protein
MATTCSPFAQSAWAGANQLDGGGRELNADAVFID